MTLEFASHEGLAVIGTVENEDSEHIPILGSSNSAIKVKVEEDHFVTTNIRGIKYYLEWGETGVKFSKIKDFNKS